MISRIVFAQITLAFFFLLSSYGSVRGQSPANPAIAIVITEIMYHPDGFLNSDDWFEVQNVSPGPVDLSNWKFRDSNPTNLYTIPAGITIPGNGYFVFVEDSVRFMERHPGVSNFVGNWDFKLSNSGEAITIFTPEDFIATSVAYTDSIPWPEAADGWGYTLDLKNSALDPANPDNWTTGCLEGSPGAAYSPCDYDFVFSEINYNSDLLQDAGDWVEIWNISGISQDISGYYFKDSKDSNEYIFPEGTMMAPDERLVVYRYLDRFESQYGSLSPVYGPFDFNLAGGGDVVRFLDPDTLLLACVIYDDKSPWPPDADGDGFTLELDSESGRMCDAGNWFVGCPLGSPTTPFIFPCGSGIGDGFGNISGLELYPNPTNGEFVLNIELKKRAEIQVELFDLRGRLVERLFKGSLMEGENNVQVAMQTGGLSGIYWVKIAEIEGRNNIIGLPILILK